MPLLDVVFLLLTFFAFAIVLMVRAEVLGVELPVLEAGPEAAAEASDPTVLTITADGELAINGEAMDEAAALSVLREAQAVSNDFALLLEVDAGAPSGRLLEIVQQLRREGFLSFGILGQRESDAATGPTPPQ